MRVALIAGGARYNAIPHQTVAAIAVAEAEVGQLTDAVESFAATVREELAATEPELAITATPAELPGMIMTPEAQHRIVGALYSSPNGVMRMSYRVPGLVETSTNLGTVSCGGATGGGVPGAQRGRLGARRRAADDRQRVRPSRCGDHDP